MRSPYIGITGFMSRQEIETVLEVVPRESHHQLMVGVLATSRTLRGEKNKWPGRFPRIDQIRDIFLPDPRVLNLIHYSTDDPRTLDRQLMHLGELFGGLHLDGFQLNVCWPSPAKIGLVQRNYKHIVLQIGHHALEEVGRDPIKLAKRIYAYEDDATGVLLDPSGGLGRPFDPAFARAALTEIRARHPGLGLGIAGGLSAETLDELVGPLVKEFPDVSIDAEGRLRTPQPEDKLDLDRAKQYVAHAFEILK